MALPVACCALGLSVVAYAQDSGALRGVLAGDDLYGAYLDSDATQPQPEEIFIDPVLRPTEASAPTVVELATGVADAEEATAAAVAPPTDDAPTGTVPAETIDAATDLAVDRSAERAEAIENLDRPAEDRPYEALGVRVGSFILKPTLEQGVTATTNADSSAGGEGALISETTLRLNAASDWTSHSASVDAYGIFRKSISGDEIEDAQGGVSAALELELGKEYHALATLGYALAPESATSPIAIPNAESQPLRQTTTGSLGLEKDAGKARFGITGDVENNRYGEAELEGGGVLSQDDRDQTLYTIELRAGYEISPALTPFVATEIGRRVYDLELDSAGYARSADRLGLRAGLELDLGEKLFGEVSVGWIREDFDDERLAAISGATIATNLAWSPVRGTIVGLAGSTTVEGATGAGESGSMLYSGALSVERAMRANLTGNAALGAAYRDYAGCSCYDVILSGELGLIWWLNRYAGLTGRLRHEDLTSNIPDRDSDTSSVFVGLKLQR